MTTCHDIQERLGEFLDGELSASARAEVQAHLNACALCREELGELAHLAESLAERDSVPAIPSGLWSSVERRLDSTCASQSASAPPRRLLFNRRLAAAAAIVLAVGLTLTGLLSFDRRVAASEINFAVLLEALPFDEHDAFAQFIAHNQGQRTTPEEARRFAKALSFDTPDELPGGFRLKEIYALRVGSNPGVAARYERDGELLVAIFHPPVKREDFGTHKDYPCVVGKHRGHKVEVGEWKLVHVTDPSTCHCVLSRLNEETELPPILAAVAPGSEHLNGHEHP
jgi:hypothetical protein